MLCWAVDFNFKFPKRTFFGAMLSGFLSRKKARLAKLGLFWTVANIILISCQEIMILHMCCSFRIRPYHTAGSSPSQIDILGELRDTHHPKNCLSYLFKTEPLIRSFKRKILYRRFIFKKYIYFNWYSHSLRSRRLEVVGTRKQQIRLTGNYGFRSHEISCEKSPGHGVS